MFYYLAYKKLKDITLTQKPYRGTHNRFPVGSRTQSNKYFLTEEINGESIARVIYGERRQYTSINKELHDYLRGKLNVNVVQRGSPTEPTFYRIDTVPNELGIVHEDNTFEFTAHHLNQGENNILSKWSEGYLNTSIRHGGVVFSGFEKFHPIWQGARFNTETSSSQPHTPYQVFGLRVKRKEAKDFFKSYEKFFTIARTMSTAMDWDNFQSAGIEVINQHITGFDWEQVVNWYDDTRASKFKAKAHELKDISPFDAYVLYLCAYNSNVIHRFANGVGVKRSYYREVGLHELYLGFHRRVTQDLYKATPDLFNHIEYEAGKKYPANNWGIKVIVDGKQVKQY
jgi:hypothetical protein